MRKNKLNGSDLAVLKSACPNLYKIKLGYNDIQSLDALKIFVCDFYNLKDGTKVRKLELEGNPVAKKQKYKEELFRTIKNL